MKRIRILAVLVIIVFLFVELGDAGRGFMDGWNEGGEQREFSSFPISLSLQAHEAAKTDSVFCPQLNTYASYEIETVSVNSAGAGIEPSAWRTVLMIVSMLLALFMIYGFYCLFRMVFFVTKGDVFTRKNVYRMRCFAYGVILVSICMEAGSWLQYTEVASQVQFAGYEVASYTLKGEWLFYIILALLTEIFAVGVKLKEEQDLTI